MKNAHHMMYDAYGEGSLCTKKNLEIKTDHRSLWWNNDQSSKVVPIPNTKGCIYFCQALAEQQRAAMEQQQKEAELMRQQQMAMMEKQQEEQQKIMQQQQMIIEEQRIQQQQQQQPPPRGNP